MGTAFRNSPAALALILTASLLLTSQAAFAGVGCGIEPQITINIGTAEAPPYSPESLNDTAFLTYSVVGGPSASLDILVTRYLAPVDATGKIPEEPPGTDTHHPPPSTYPTHLESLGILRSKAILKFSYSFHDGSSLR